MALVLLVPLLLALLVIPTASALRRAGLTGRLLRREGSPPWCVRCGYSLVGLPAGSNCPECGSIVRTLTHRRTILPLALTCCVLCHGVSLVCWAVVMREQTSLFYLIAFVVLTVPITLSVWAVCIVARREDQRAVRRRWLIVLSIAALAGLPFGVEAVIVFSLGIGRSGADGIGGLAHEVALAILPTFSSLVGMAAFTVAGLITALMLHIRRPDFTSPA